MRSIAFLGALLVACGHPPKQGAIDASTATKSATATGTAATVVTRTATAAATAASTSTAIAPYEAVGPNEWQDPMSGLVWKIGDALPVTQSPQTAVCGPDANIPDSTEVIAAIGDGLATFAAPFALCFWINGSETHDPNTLHYGANQLDGGEGACLPVPTMTTKPNGAQVPIFPPPVQPTARYLCLKPRS